MAADNKEAIENGLFSRKKSLLTVQQYANSQGISAGVVQECAKLGVVQIRKHKDKMFIVDLPLDASKTARQQGDIKVEQIDSAAQAQRISNMVSKIFKPETPLIKPVINQPKTEIAPAQTSAIAPAPAAIPDLNIFAQEEDKAATAGNEVFTPVPTEFKVSFGRKIYDAFKITSTSKVAMAVMFFAIAAAIGTYFWMSAQRNAQQQQLQQAYENITKLMNAKDMADRKAKLYELDSFNWKTEAQRNQKSVANLEVELVATKEKLTQTQDSLSKIQQNHIDTLKQINQRIQEITTQVQERTEK